VKKGRLGLTGGHCRKCGFDAVLPDRTGGRFCYECGADEESYWDFVKRTAREVTKWPAWKRGASNVRDSREL
jgi:hypothetical protein